MPFLDIKQLAIKLNVKESLIRQLVFRRKIPYIKISRLLRFDEKKVDEWLELTRKESENEKK